ncbi:MAG: hypothetical protein ACE5FD_05075, partial [Anaerolineae bacterium]
CFSCIIFDRLILPRFLTINESVPVADRPKREGNGRTAIPLIPYSFSPRTMGKIRQILFGQTYASPTFATILPPK